MDNIPNNRKRLYNTQEAARELGVSLSTLFRFMKDGKLPRRKLGGKTVVSADDLDAFVAGLEVI